MTDFRLDNDTQKQITSIELMLQDIKSTIREISRLIEKTTNTELQVDLKDLSEKFDRFSGTVLETKMNALAKTLDNVHESITQYVETLKKILDKTTEVILNQTEYKGLGKDIQQAILKLKEIRCESCEIKLNEISDKLNNNNLLNKLIELLKQHFGKITIITVLLILSLLASCDKFNADKAVNTFISKNTIKELVGEK